MYDFKPFQWECEKTISASNLRYRIRLEDHVPTDASGSPEATMFTFSYLQKEGGQNRPVLFAYNGGPGAGDGRLQSIIAAVDKMESSRGNVPGLGRVQNRCERSE